LRLRDLSRSLVFAAGHSSSEKEQSVVAATKDQASYNLGAEAAVLNTKKGIHYGLDLVGTQIWKLLQTPCKVADTTIPRPKCSFGALPLSKGKKKNE
jgi:hypothetical protein